MIQTGVYFGELHSFHGLNLVLSKVEISPAPPKETYVDVPGGDGSIDLTEAQGEVKYGDRDITFTFSMLPTDELSWEEKKTQVSNALNGLRCKITLDRDSEYYYFGRCTVSAYAQNKRLRQITVKAKVNPYKLKQNPTVFSASLTSTEKEYTLHNDRKSVVPDITCTADNTTIVFNGGTYKLNAGTHKVLNICFKEGNNVLKLSGSGTITITYREGAL